MMRLPKEFRNYRVIFGVYNTKGTRSQVEHYVSLQGGPAHATWTALHSVARTYMTESSPLAATRIEVESVERLEDR